MYISQTERIINSLLRKKFIDAIILIYKKKKTYQARNSVCVKTLKIPEWSAGSINTEVRCIWGLRQTRSVFSDFIFILIFM